MHFHCAEFPVDINEDQQRNTASTPLNTDHNSLRRCGDCLHNKQLFAMSHFWVNICMVTSVSGMHHLFLGCRAAYLRTVPLPTEGHSRASPDLMTALEPAPTVGMSCATEETSSTTEAFVFALFCCAARALAGGRGARGFAPGGTWST